MLINDHGVRDAELIVRGWRGNIAAAVYRDDRQLLRAVEAGQCVVGLAGSSVIARFQRATSASNVTPLWFPEPGVQHVNPTGAGVTRHAANPALAVSLLEWLTSANANALYASRILHFPVNSQSVADVSIAAWRKFEMHPASFASLRYWQEDAFKLAERARYP